MTDNNNPQPADAASADEAVTAEGASLQILAQYMKDLSFENPNAPKSLGGSEENPEVGVSVNVNVQQVGKSEFEVGLHFRVETKRGEEVSFLTELVYCGLFRALNIPEENLRPVLLSKRRGKSFHSRAVSYLMSRAMVASHPSCLTQ